MIIGKFVGEVGPVCNACLRKGEKGHPIPLGDGPLWCARCNKIKGNPRTVKHAKKKA